ncbi:MFS transporter [Pseudomonas sp. TH05]|uniref:MFS transporter n=1 Tax=unclassified Pseudomonas TaxID=196821 RepID=UPI00191322DA|nr:MFS transporter [Pseudomonas sp. TH07]MBK5559967.1 MFS transporter [Pseudomonas sp. TH05]
MKPIIAHPEPALRGVLASLSLSMLLSSLGTSIANVGLPALAQAFEASFQQVQWVVLAYLLAITTLIISVGRLGDLMGRRRLLLAGIALFTLASLGCALAPNLGWLLGARAIQGLGAAIMMALAMAFVGDSVPKAQTGSAMGLLGSMSAIGTALGPALGGVLIAWLGWRAIFVLNLPLGLLALALAYRYLPADRPRAEAGPVGFDYSGTLLLALALAAYALATTLGHGRFDWRNAALLLTAAVAGGLFLWGQGRVASPLIRLALFREPLLGASLLMNGLVSTVMMATLVVGPFYLSRGLGLDLAVVGAVMAMGPVVSALSGVPAGRVVDQLGAPRGVVLGLFGMLAGAVALSVLAPLFGVVGYVAGLVILTPGYQLFQAANNTAVMQDVQADQRGAMSGLLSLSRNLGLISGASVIGAVFALASSASELSTSAPDAMSHGLRVSFAVATGLLLMALVIARWSQRAPGASRADYGG